MAKTGADCGRGLSSGGDLWRPGGSGPVILRHRVAHGLRYTNDDRHYRRRRLGLRRDVLQPRDEGHTAGFGYSTGVMLYQAKCARQS